MLQNIFNITSKIGYIQHISKESTNYIKIGPIGLLLQNNLKTQWYNNIVINKDITVFPSKGDIQQTYEFARRACFERLPFGIAETTWCADETCKEKIDEMSKEKATIFKNLFEKKDRVILRSTYFVPSTTATQFFHEFQKQRRMWWRKFSASPGRYSLTDIKTINESKQHVEVKAEYPWGSQLLESIVLSSTIPGFPSYKLQYRESKKNVVANVLTSEVNLPVMFLNAICDAYDEPLYKNDKREILRLHRKLAPYRISFAITSSVSPKLAELKDLALYLTKQLRSMNCSTLLLPSSYLLTLEAQFKHYDQIGIPYTVILNEKTLVDGISLLRSRDTTLKEQVHVTSLVSYVEKLFKND